ncbi:alpha/beta hydrolase fold domain containing protein [Amanita muscaria]
MSEDSEPQSKTKALPSQPLHPSVIPKLDPEYIEFHNATFQYLPPVYAIPWNPAFRGPKLPGTTKPLEVGKIQDYELTNTDCRTYTPPGEKPQSGWPLFITFHGGGWMFGRIDSDASFATRMCLNANCVVMAVNYRLAPEHPYPAAVEDAIDSLQWVVKHGKDKLNVDMTRIAVGGMSEGGNLAAALALKAPTITPPLPYPLIFQLLVVPITDNTSTATSPHASWKTYEHAPLRTAKAMLWFRHNYLPDEAKRSDWLVSPLLAPEDVLSGAPKTWVAVAEVDILKDEAEKYAEKLESAGVSVKVVCYEKVPHMFASLDGVLSAGKRLVQDAGEALKEAFLGS